MKKILAITVAFMYLGITSGLVLQIHYCMGKQTGSSVQFAEVNDHTCASCGMKNGSNNCCHDDVKFIKLQDVHQQVSADYSIPGPAAVIPDVNFINISSSAVTDSVVNCATYPPPDDDDGQPSLLILHHLLRI